MKTIRIDFCDFWPGFRKDDNRIYNLLKTRYAVELCDRPDFIVYSSFGHHHRLNSCIRIFFTGESHRPDFSTCDYAFTCHYLDDPRHLRWPLLGHCDMILSHSIKPVAQRRRLFSLGRNADWCVWQNPAGADGSCQCPLLAEFDAIGSLNPHSVALIDDWQAAERTAAVYEQVLGG